MHPLVFILLAIIGGLFVFGVVRASIMADRERIENALWKQGIRLESCRYAPWGPGVWSVWSGRKYAVVFVDGDGRRWRGTIATSLWDPARIIRAVQASSSN
ncbi:MAG: hypothetical protein CVU59_01170 [Deltaproteobacteria bacterium HGW-Deltaproteobacteria-17]|nr:MAG: hypothetical protein CVU59_01170 [Deltaproteobacteria bacterium HGW-Deltaproteobacteria-17]